MNKILPTIKASDERKIKERLTYLREDERWNYVYLVGRSHYGRFLGAGHCNRTKEQTDVESLRAADVLTAFTRFLACGGIGWNDASLVLYAVMRDEIAEARKQEVDEFLERYRTLSDEDKEVADEDYELYTWTFSAEELAPTYDVV